MSMKYVLRLGKKGEFFELALNKKLTFFYGIHLAL